MSYGTFLLLVYGIIALAFLIDFVHFQVCDNPRAAGYSIGAFVLNGLLVGALWPVTIVAGVVLRWRSK